MSPCKPSRLQLLLIVVVLIARSSAINAIEAFPDSGSRASVVGRVVAPQVFTAASSAAKTNLRSGSSATDAITASDASDSVHPGGNGFGRVSYNENAPATRSTSDGDSSASDGDSTTATVPVESQAEYRARVWKAEKEAERKYPYLRMQNLVSF